MGTRIIIVAMENKHKFTPDPNFKLLDQVRETLRYYHYARSTERTYCQWMMRYICFFEKKVHHGLFWRLQRQKEFVRLILQQPGQ